MDIRTGRTYETQEEARAAGVPDSDIALVTERDIAGEPPDVKFITSGPFKGRIYRRIDGQMVRVRK